MEEKLEKYRKTIELCSSIMKEIKAERMSNTKMGKYVNVFSLWNEFSGISEPIHSRILHFFLSDNPMHGQGKLFLSAFLEYIGFEQDEGNEEWIITAEEGRVDILLRRLNPLGAVIIENKSNWAGINLTNCTGTGMRIFTNAKKIAILIIIRSTLSAK